MRLAKHLNEISMKTLERKRQESMIDIAPYLDTIENYIKTFRHILTIKIFINPRLS